MLQVQEAAHALLAAQDKIKELSAARGPETPLAREDSSTDGESVKSELAKVYYMF